MLRGLFEALLKPQGRLPLVYHEAYRLPVTWGRSGAEALEARRADDAASYLLGARACRPSDVITPGAASYDELLRVHSQAYLDSLQEPRTLARIFAADEVDVFADEVLRTVRLGVGGTVAAARVAVRQRTQVLNTFGGFHHAAPERGGGFCALNDVAVAIAELRREGFTARIAVLDFDFHPPDGTAACLGRDDSVWLGSLSGTSWGELPGVDETVLPPRTGDDVYLAALGRLLTRMPRVGLAFVLAGGDVLAGDRLGTLSLTLSGVRRRDLRIKDRLGNLPQVWLPAGGYGPHAWRVLAGTGLALAFGSTEEIPAQSDPLRSRMVAIARKLNPEELGSAPLLSEEDLAEAFGQPRAGPPRFLGFYTAQGLEMALEQLGILPYLRRLGFDQLRVVLDRVDPYDRMRLLGRDVKNGQPVTLVELEASRRSGGHEGGSVLFVNWLSLRNPRARFSPLRPQLPGQEVPGLGLAREFTQVLALMATRLVLDGVAFQPSWYHMAYASRYQGRFVDPARQGRFEAMLRDLKDVPLLKATRAVAAGQVRLNGQQYRWEPDLMVAWVRPPPLDEAAVARAREESHFTIAGD